MFRVVLCVGREGSLPEMVVRQQLIVSVLMCLVEWQRVQAVQHDAAAGSSRARTHLDVADNRACGQSRRVVQRSACSRGCGRP